MLAKCRIKLTMTPFLKKEKKEKKEKKTMILTYRYQRILTFFSLLILIIKYKILRPYE